MSRTDVTILIYRFLFEYSGLLNYSRKFCKNYPWSFMISSLNTSAIIWRIFDVITQTWIIVSIWSFDEVRMTWKLVKEQHTVACNPLTSERICRKDLSRGHGMLADNHSLYGIIRIAATNNATRERENLVDYLPATDILLRYKRQIVIPNVRVMSKNRCGQNAWLLSRMGPEDTH